MPKVVDPEERKQVIARATWQVINRVGVERLTMVDVAKAAGFTTGSLVHYFRFKEDIIEHAFLRAARLISDEISSDCAKLEPGMARLYTTIVGSLPAQRNRDKKAYWHLCLWIPANGPRKLVRQYRESYGQWREQILAHFDDAIALGQVSDPGDREREVDMLITFVDGIGFNMLADPKRSTLSSELKYIDLLLLRLFDWQPDRAMTTGRAGQL